MVGRSQADVVPTSRERTNSSFSYTVVHSTPEYYLSVSQVESGCPAVLAPVVSKRKSPLLFQGSSSVKNREGQDLFFQPVLPGMALGLFLQVVEACSSPLAGGLHSKEQNTMGKRPSCLPPLEKKMCWWCSPVSHPHTLEMSAAKDKHKPTHPEACRFVLIGDYPPE